jgi:parallel beta-helix repeat protein
MARSWIKRILKQSSPATRGRDRKRTARLALEGLEARTVLTVFNVTTTADVLGGPALSLRQAILDANLTGGPHTINLTVPGTYQLTRFGNAHDGTNGALQILNPNLTINGLGAAVTVIDGGGVDRVFDIERVGIALSVPLSVTFNGVTIQHGLAGGNGNKGTDVNGSTTFGAGIYSPQVDLTLTNTVVAGNQAFNSGGGIWTDTGNVTITGGAVSDNSADDEGGGLFTRSGAIALTNTTFAGNLAESSGGAVVIDSSTSAGNLTIAGSTFSGNVADDGGGAIIDFSMVNKVSVTASTISDNTAESGGGGLEILAATFTIDHSTISNNTAGSTGGGIKDDFNSNQVLKITSSAVAGNTAGNDGGGIISIAASATFTSDSFSSNVAEDGAGIDFSGIGLTLSSSHVDSNLAQNFAGGLSMLSRVNGSSCTIAGSTLDDNRAASDDGGGSVQCTSLIVRNSSVSGNRTGGSNGGLDVQVTTATFANVNVIGNVAGNGEGGLDLVQTTLTMTGCTIANNRSGNSVGGMFADGTATISGTIITGNHTAEAEGGLDFVGIQLSLVGVTITNNTAAGSDGGALLFATNGGTVSNSTISGNRAAARAGGLEIDSSGGTLTITGCTISDNHAGTDGGGVLHDGGGTLTLSNVTLFGNTAGVNGGGIAHETTASALNLLNVTIDGNAAANGGGVFSNQPTVNVRNTLIAGNAANAGQGPDVNGTFATQGFNFIGVADAASTGFTNGTSHDQVGSAAAPLVARLGLLENNGGSTFTQALLPGSPAIGRGDPSGAPTTDQRGFMRPATPSIGAFEPQSAANASANQVFVESVFETLLGRPAGTGAAGFVSELNAGAATVTVVLQIEASLEYRMDQVQALYQHYLHRNADAVGLQGFANFLGQGGTLKQVAAVLTGSQEYFDLHGDSTNAFLDALYQDVLGRQVDPGGRAGFSQALAGGMTRGQAASLILGSAEYQGNLVQADFQSFLGRSAEPAAQAFFVNELQHGGSDQLVLAQVLGSNEAFVGRA